MRKVTVMIVDDSSVMRKIVARALRSAGLEIERVLEADNGATALSMVSQGPPDVIFSDIHMPIMDGLEFVRRLQNLPEAKGIPIVMLTTEGSQSRVMEAIALGARGYIRKPFSPDQVREQLRSLIEG
jgi:two-component system, chemotaxis family, chemotaxis protein CheY